MGIGYISWSKSLCLILIVAVNSHGNGEVTNVLQLHSMDANKHREDYDHHHQVDHVHDHTLPSKTHHIDPSLLVFFFIEDLKQGKTIPIFFPNRDPSKSPQLLPRDEVDSFPFSLEKLPILLEKFSFSQSSSQAKAMEDTLRQCELKPIIGETKICATSSESLIDFIHGIFGPSTPFQTLSTTHFSESKTHKALLQNYTIMEKPQEVSAEKMVACHTMPYPYGVLYCHYQESESKVFKVMLMGENGEKVIAVAVCHMDTSHWSPNHVAFQVLGVEPGSSPVCHFFPADHSVWVDQASQDV